MVVAVEGILPVVSRTPTRTILVVDQQEGSCDQTSFPQSIGCLRKCRFGLLSCGEKQALPAWVSGRKRVKTYGSVLRLLLQMVAGLFLCLWLWILPGDAAHHVLVVSGPFPEKSGPMGEHRTRKVLKSWHLLARFFPQTPILGRVDATTHPPTVVLLP
jgi:hypothetical protein